MNDAPVQTDRRLSANENTGNTLLVTATATDEDAGQTLVYALSRTASVCWAFTISAAQASAQTRNLNGIMAAVMVSHAL